MVWLVVRDGTRSICNAQSFPVSGDRAAPFVYVLQNHMSADDALQAG